MHAQFEPTADALRITGYLNSRSGALDGIYRRPSCTVHVSSWAHVELGRPKDMEAPRILVSQVASSALSAAGDRRGA